MKKISNEMYLQALGIFTMATQHAQKTQEYADALVKHLDITPYGHLYDAIYDGRLKDFDSALMLEDIEVEKN